jgi:prepilin-type N-terminal cleavage/methylation domain-containing protein
MQGRTEMMGREGRLASPGDPSGPAAPALCAGRSGLRMGTPRRGGYSLLEVVTAIAILGILTVLLGRFFVGGSRAWELGTRTVDEAAMGRVVINAMARDLADAVFDLPGRTNSALGLAVFPGATSFMDHAQSELYFTAFHKAPTPAIFQNGIHVKAVCYYVSEIVETNAAGVGQNTGRYALWRAEVPGSSTNAFAQIGGGKWYESAVDQALLDLPVNRRMLVENVRAFQAFYVDEDGNCLTGAETLVAGRPRLGAVDIYLEIFDADSAREAAELYKANASVRKSYADRKVMRFYTRVFPRNKSGFYVAGREMNRH